MRPYLEKPFAKIRLVEVAQGEGPEFKPQYCIYIYIYIYENDPV
jgi:hypothetical protein